MKDAKFLIITGLSGSGKTVVSHFLEDLGFYCLDNLPVKMIPIFVDLWRRKEIGIGRVALIVDIRERGFLKAFPDIWEAIRRKVPAKLVFLEASDESLVKRFSETRRPHPLTRKSVLQSVRLERTQLGPIKAMADEVIDTSAMTISRLKEVISERFLKSGKPRLQTTVLSFGYKYGVPYDADLIFDTRFLPNPFYHETLRPKTGLDRSVRDFVLNDPETKAFLGELFGFVGFLMPRFIAEGKTHLTLAVGCTGGRHRSVVIGEKLGEMLARRKYDIKLVHRDLDK
jgi:RNase adapter protein RapZ